MKLELSVGIPWAAIDPWAYFTLRIESVELGIELDVPAGPTATTDMWFFHYPHCAHGIGGVQYCKQCSRHQFGAGSKFGDEGLEKYLRSLVGNVCNMLQLELLVHDLMVWAGKLRLAFQLAHQGPMMLSAHTARSQELARAFSVTLDLG